jgi:8-oxo-dGTP pyrophosphatase MutT (NUDIX family)
MDRNTIKPLRLSASIILALGDEKQQRTTFLMLVRKPHMSFENSLVFPGGACDKEDEAYSNEFHQFAKITAVRELMEETGILLLPPGYALWDLSQLRAKYASRKL